MRRRRTTRYNHVHIDLRDVHPKELVMGSTLADFIAKLDT